jgi:DNA invertase Pin-like site-specific DNA recombinase
MQERCARWFRASSDAQDESHQYREVDGHVAARGYDVARTFRLHDVSASKGEHEPQLEELLEDIRAGRYTVVVVAHSSRLDRRGVDEAMLTEIQIRLAGGRVESVREPEFGADSLAGRVMSLLAMNSNHEYTATLSGHVRAAKTTIRANGAWDGHPPFGLEAVGDKYRKRLVVTDDGRRVIPLVYDRVIEKMPLSAIAREVAGILGRPVWARTISGWIRNPAYRGAVSEYDKATGVYGRVKYRYDPPLVDAATWKRANAELDSRPSNSRGKKYVRHDETAGKKTYTADPAGRSLLASILTCGRCDGPMYRANAVSRRKSGPDVRCLYYRCYGAGPDRRGCGAPMVPLEQADALAVQLMSGLNIPVQVTILVPGENHNAEIESVKFELRDLDVDEAGYLDKHAALMERLTEIRALPVTEDSWETISGDRTYADEFRELAPERRNQWMKDRNMAFTAQRGGRSPMWKVFEMPQGYRRSRASDGDVIVTVSYSPGRLLSR